MSMSKVNRFARPYLFLLCMCLLVGTGGPSISGAWAQKWAEDMFPQREHEFGTVAKNSEAIYEFEFTNLYKEELVIRAVRSSCGCITPSYTKQRIGSLETGKIVAKYNTDRFIGARQATVTVTFEKPFYAEVQLKASGYIRGDVALEPGIIDFGSLSSVDGVRKSTSVDYRGGRQGWEIVDVQSTFPHVRVALEETHRARGIVKYSLSARLLPEVATGLHQAELILVTNDPNNREIPVTLTAQIQSPLQVSPEHLDLGDLTPGQTITKHVLVRSSAACEIASVIGDHPAVSVQAPQGEKTLHRIPVVFTAGSASGRVKAALTIQTAAGGKETVEISANVLGGAATDASDRP